MVDIFVTLTMMNSNGHMGYKICACDFDSIENWLPTRWTFDSASIEEAVERYVRNHELEHKRINIFDWTDDPVEICYRPCEAGYRA